MFGKHSMFKIFVRTGERGSCWDAPGCSTRRQNRDQNTQPVRIAQTTLESCMLYEWQRFLLFFLSFFFFFFSRQHTNEKAEVKCWPVGILVLRQHVHNKMKPNIYFRCWCCMTMRWIWSTTKESNVESFLTIFGLNGGRICLLTRASQSIGLKKPCRMMASSPSRVQPRRRSEFFVKNWKRESVWTREEKGRIEGGTASVCEAHGKCMWSFSFGQRNWLSGCYLTCVHYVWEVTLDGRCHGPKLYRDQPEAWTFICASQTHYSLLLCS